METKDLIVIGGASTVPVSRQTPQGVDSLC
ncbi:Uncharacterised protein [Cronobacter sakazakii]|nr:Uncharacterised protein [Cronobacter sakazakii]